MHARPFRALASAALGLLLTASAAPLMASGAEMDFAAAKAKAAETGKLVLVDFSSPT